VKAVHGGLPSGDIPTYCKYAVTPQGRNNVIAVNIAVTPQGRNIVSVAVTPQGRNILSVAVTPQGRNTVPYSRDCKYPPIISTPHL
jgi:hypothetical protein